MSRQLRLLKVAVTPVFVVDDGEQLTELTLNPPTIMVPAQEWPEFATGRFQDLWRELEEQIQANFQSPTVPLGLDQPDASPSTESKGAEEPG